MKKNELSPEDFSALANAVADLPFVKPNRPPADYMLDLMETVINFWSSGDMRLRSAVT